MAAVLTAFRASPPAALGGRAVRATTDLRAGGDGLPPTDAVILDLEGGARVIVRPSGTEPKVKCYAQVVVPVADGGDVAQARQRAAVVLRVLAADLDGALVAPPR